MSASNPSRPEPTEIAGRFQVVQKLGAGAFGTVYKAKDKVLGRMLAIKTIRLEGLAASQTGLAEMVERFQREARVAAQLKHPNIVTIYDIGEAEGMSYISMEFIDGVGIDHIIQQSGRLSVERAAALAAQVADGLDYAHKHGVVHRDIKPANIMVEPGDRVKVTDFGIAKPGDSAEHLTMTGSLLGTPSYMSPEQARGQKLDGRSDLFSLGCVIYEMIGGRKAFRGDSITALLFKIITEEPPALRDLDPTMPEGMIHLLEKALAKSPDARYQTGREMADDLLALTRPTSMPTMRSTDVPTLPPEMLPTMVQSPTAVAPGTVASRTSSTLPHASGGATQPPTAATALTPPPVGPTVLTPPPSGTAESTGGRSARAHPPARTTPPAGRGPGAGLVLGLIGVGLVFVLAAAGAGWWFVKHRSAPANTTAETTTPTTLTAETSSGASATPEPRPTEGASVPAAGEATPQPEPNQPHAPSTPPPAAGPGRSERPRPTANEGRPAEGQAPADAPPARVAQQAPPPSGNYGYLNEVPADGPDGRDLGDAAAKSYRSGNNQGGVTGRRFSQRPRVPRDLAPEERPAVATLLHVAFAEQAYRRANGRYGTLQDLRAAGLLRLDVPFQNGVFERARYRFQLQGASGGSDFKITATPLTAARPFYTDDNGYVLVDE